MHATTKQRSEKAREGARGGVYLVLVREMAWKSLAIVDQKGAIH